MITAKRIGVLAGGTSAEREVSLRSGSAVHKALLSRGYDAVFIDAGEDLCEVLKRERVELAFVVLHGGAGENGAVQGLLEVLGVPYTGSGVMASALAMDKEASKMVFSYHEIPVTPFMVVRRGQLGSGSRINLQLLITMVGIPLPWVVKPATEGSSIGVSIVKEEGEIEDAVRDAFAYGDRIIIETFVKGKEVQIGILDQRALGGVEVRPSREFYSYEAKYTPGLTEYILPPEIDSAAYTVLETLALRAHRALGCKGATRVDFILDEANNPYLLEVNTIPGMTETSLLPKIARLAGLEFPDLIEEILACAAGERAHS
ncbi:MAG: D-alanine--D-alanine ligase [Nitrospirota bacterium]